MTVWRDRLHLFWVTLLEKPAMENDPDSGVTLNAGMSVQKAVQRQIEIQLSWCEQLQGEWQTRSSSGFADPVRTFVPADFDGRDGYIHTTTNYEADGSEGSLDVHLGGSFKTYGIGILGPAATTSAYRLQSKNAPPRRQHGVPRMGPPYVTLTRTTQPTRYDGAGSLQVILTDRGSAGPPVKQDILRRGRTLMEPAFGLLPANGSLEWDPSRPRAERLASPFFYVNDVHSFFVEPHVTQVRVKDHDRFGIETIDVNHLEDDDFWKDLPVLVELPKIPGRDPLAA